MSSYPPPPYAPPPGFDPRQQRRWARDQARAQRDVYRAQVQAARYSMRGMRRTSVVGPILLIAIGVVFLLIQVGRLPSTSVWDWYAHWWPVILLGAGIVLLAEWAWDQQRLRDPQQPQYRRSLGGGVVTLLLLVTISGVVARQVHNPMAADRLWSGLHLGPDNIDEFLGDKHESDQTVDQPFPAGDTLRVMNPRGDVTLSGTSDDGQIHVAVHKQVYSRSDSEADSKAEKLQPRMVADGSVLVLNLPKVDGGRADLVITLPATAGPTVIADRGDIHIASVKAAVTATANHGDVELSAISGPATAHVNNSGSSLSAHSLSSGINIGGHAQDVTLSDITGPVTIMGEFFGTTHLEHIAGPVHFRTSRTDFQLGRLDGEIDISPRMELTADQVMGPLVLTTSNRNIRLDRVQGDISVTNRNGEINLTAAPQLGTITLQNRNGTIHTTVPEHSNFTVQANTTDGDIHTDFPLDSRTDGDRREIKGAVGSGGGQSLHITTTHGDISIDQASVMPLPPTPPSSPKLSTVPVVPAVPKPPAGPRRLHPISPPEAPAAAPGAPI